MAKALHSAANASPRPRGPAISASCRSDTTAKRLDGTRNGKIVASSDGLKIETMRPTGRIGLP